MVTRLALNGATGRMGTTVRDAAGAREALSAVLGVAPEADGELVVTPTERRDALVAHDVDVVVDFSTAKAVPALAQDCADAEVALVSGTTGLGDSALDAIEAASAEIPVVHARNFSQGIVALRRALDAALDAVGDYDIEVAETHHRGKQDAPSGTATTLVETVTDHRTVETVNGRAGTHVRGETEVGVHSRRAGNVRGEHEVMLADNDEVLRLCHRAEDRSVFAAGALTAADWLAGRDPGRYDIEDVLTGNEDDSDSQ
ncbi:dihydrodipicolinate reductase [Halovenus aranensis]|jgi:4-hydroxy-tetrahydrodipicolinate reductase|uniref:4-hydroxy-tetrahydrodipicolinate reductase n=1 Tax=Halovenus aranensis TaxID=890420 RepID=A0A1G8Y0R1_9EURY|nr:4-hydroxy-tetrahydrodipicolinate reductase [Halovenus aranensis]SDJ96439.1 dihydrodipicolinate reductase [Halovenus aranensis]